MKSPRGLPAQRGALTTFGNPRRATKHDASGVCQRCGPESNRHQRCLSGVTRTARCSMRWSSALGPACSHHAAAPSCERPSLDARGYYLRTWRRSCRYPGPVPVIGTGAGAASCWFVASHGSTLISATNIVTRTQPSIGLMRSSCGKPATLKCSQFPRN